MDITTFIASIWGPIILAVGFGVFLNAAYYRRVYRDIEKDSLAMLVFGMFAMAVGLIQVQVHNVWDTFPQIVVSLVSWAVLLKGVAFLIAPKFVDQIGDKWVNMSLVPFAGTGAIIIGAYLTYLGYIA